MLLKIKSNNSYFFFLDRIRFISLFKDISSIYSNMIFLKKNSKLSSCMYVRFSFLLSLASGKIVVTLNIVIHVLEKKIHISINFVIIMYLFVGWFINPFPMYCWYTCDGRISIFIALNLWQQTFFGEQKIIVRDMESRNYILKKLKIQL